MDWKPFLSSSSEYKNPADQFSDKHPGRYIVLGIISAGLALLAGWRWWIVLCAFFIGPVAISWFAWAVAPLFKR